MSWRIKFKRYEVRLSCGTLGETVGRLHGPPLDPTAHAALWVCPTTGIRMLYDLRAVDDQGRVWDVPSAMLLERSKPEPDGALAETCERPRLTQEEPDESFIVGVK